jgi:hypothetical protein
MIWNRIYFVLGDWVVSTECYSFKTKGVWLGPLAKILSQLQGMFLLLFEWTLVLVLKCITVWGGVTIVFEYIEITKTSLSVPFVSNSLDQTNWQKTHSEMFLQLLLTQGLQYNISARHIERPKWLFAHFYYY